MLRVWAVRLLLSCAAVGCVVMPGCAGLPAQRPAPIACYQNPTNLPVANREVVWQNLVDVVDDYFVIAREERVQLVGDVLTEGRIDTLPVGGATFFEPWRGDTVTAWDRAHSTLQSTRRTATIRVMPTAVGFDVHVAVFRELEDVETPLRASSSAAIFRNDGSLTRLEQPIGEQPLSRGWIPDGHDVALEQQIIAQLRTRLGLPLQ